jgi:hypothetical protein
LFLLNLPDIVVAAQLDLQLAVDVKNDFGNLVLRALGVRNVAAFCFVD